MKPHIPRRRTRTFCHGTTNLTSMTVFTLMPLVVTSRCADERQSGSISHFMPRKAYPNSRSIPMALAYTLSCKGHTTNALTSKSAARIANGRLWNSFLFQAGISQVRSIGPSTISSSVSPTRYPRR